ncbi:UvrY/SirA/GacA family response regulator transcription factor [Microbulbifer thermotolerans]|uniref:DNA-binding response regulator n=1 Tax=Microbulbifer thermotolerans TaxID=252514 RepID=A0A143HM85_MICTH|nr:UvrY/SirA/GacA family response regulator transcription factor [Microbulbifer thermotolerans]AMX02606.1 DNA-binding response regulator [Microbulbifer thermotolerans]MCX2779754.1 UvrY/SirA/GacA family response regulator transcription factor [Microbulbifer thermotolerans]MCX2782314.1 UvrY/SirA/GacA family response regulator transcription factor [Microbulbifer thermotolerans]MCX2794903.1 UvrY/SirA/GacA family response regulator transcription factor [Microbulbifer thermotolerans]MCX2800467.1 Uvr
MIKVLVVDDHDLVRMGISRMLGDVNGIQVVGEANCGEEALAFLRQTEADVILMDVRMPGMGGLEATRKLLNRCPETKVIAVSALDDDLFPGRLMQAGAKGYVTKGADLEEMVKAIRTVYAGDVYISTSMATKLALRNVSGNSEKNTPFDALSERELQTAIMIVNGSKVAEIADTLSVSPKTVNSYRYRIFDKLGIHSDVELTLLAVKHQILDPEAAL